MMRLSIGSEEEASAASLPGSATPSIGSFSQTQMFVHAAAVEKSNILNLFKLTLKRLLDSMNGSGRRMMSYRHEPLQQFMLVVERVLQHGFVAGRTGFSITGNSQKSFWNALDKMDQMSPNCVEILQNVRALPDIKTGVGRGRAWIRFALMQKRLSEYFDILSHSNRVIKDFYVESSLMLDEDSLSMLSGLMVGLNVLEFNFVPKDEDLDNVPTVLDLSHFLKDGNYLERAVDNLSNISVNSYEDDRDLQQEMVEMSNQNSYLEEISKKQKNQLDELAARVAFLETEKMEIGFKLEGAELQLEEVKGLLDVLRREKGEREENERVRMERLQADLSVERETLQAMNHSLDELNQQLKLQIQSEVTHRLEVEKEVKLQASMRNEAEEATRLLEKDIHEKQDCLVSLRQQLQDIKALNIQLYNTSQERLSELEHKNSVVKQLEDKSFRMNDTLKDLQNDLKIMEQDRNAAVETARKLGAQLSDKDNAISCLETDVSIEREWRTSLQAEKEKLVQEAETLKQDLKRIPELEKEKRFEKTILQGSLHKILLQEAAQCIRIQPWDDEPDHIVEIDFPEMAVLGERQLGIEIMNTKNLEIKNKQILTDVVQITQQSHASFLRPVTVRIPLHPEYERWERTERTDKYGRKIKIENGIAQITSFVFSPAGLYYDEIEQAVHALVLGDKIDQMLHRGRVYMIVEQEINIEKPALKISLTPFFSFQEHEKCRVAKNVFFCPYPVPTEKFGNVAFFKLEWDENFITSVNENLERDLIFPIGQLNEHQLWTGHRLRYEFHDGRNQDTYVSTMTVRFGHFEKIVPLLNMEDLQRLRESAERFIPSRRDLYLCLNSIPESYGWLNFMQDCLGIDKMNFREFVYKDVLDTNRNRDPNLDEADIETTFERHMQNLTIEHFKSEVFSVSSDRLTNDNLVQLAEALRYVDGRRLREALQKGLETLSINLNGTSRKFREWVGDGDGGTEFRRADSTPSLPTLQ